MIINIKIATLQKLRNYQEKLSGLKIVAFLAAYFSAFAIGYYYLHNQIIIYGDAESHLDISKRVVSSLTPGMGQLGGVWLPLFHIFMIPFTYSDFMWRTGLAGAVISGAAYIITSIYLYLLVVLLTKSRTAGLISFLVFALNPNILYMQSTPMTELLLIMFFTLSSYYFVKYVEKQNDLFSLILAAVFGFCASITRYEGWFLVGFEAFAIIILHVGRKMSYKKIEGVLILFSAIAFYGILLWFVWDYLILRDPFYFTNSPFSAKSQQNVWGKRNMLPAYNNIILSFAYYIFTSVVNTGVIISVLAIFGLGVFLMSEKSAQKKFAVTLVLLSPAIFNIVTLYLGQSIIFIPGLTPRNFEWQIFNVRYGVMMVPIAAFFCGWLFHKNTSFGKFLIIAFIIFQSAMYFTSYAKAITLADGVIGLSHAKQPDAERWMAKNYTGGLVLLDDYARTMSIIRSDIPMENVIYIGNQYYWTDSLKNPDKWATWVIMQRDDAVWRAIYDKPEIRGRLYAHFNKVYTSKEILIFKRMR